ncbi:MAG: deoxyguanosinetriphosphate triphosphohydrolase [Deinococcota bacterium]|jgi:dGTPase|nr:deoxyguanosinetriphosphate triphosphohydrolase [Deinococcota bacterium]
MLVTREKLEAFEVQSLAPYAALAKNSRGRLHKEGESTFRTAFQKDRDRVIHTSAFRRLEYKTQVFVNYEGDHYRTRLTHTLEVAQVATSMARALGLNEDLCETIALAHDLGHPPFGHAGEMALDKLAKEAGGFDHNKQSLRIVTSIEKRYPGFPGLNLSWETLEGIMKHETDYDVPGSSWEPDKQPTLEAQVVNLADESAYNAHDLDDGLRSGHLSPEGIAEVPLIAETMENLGITPQRFTNQDRYLLIRELLGLIITDVVGHTHQRLEASKVRSLKDVRDAEGKLVCYSPPMQKRLKELKSFLYKNFYFHYRLIRMTKKAERILEAIFRAYLASPDMLPPDVQRGAEDLGLMRAITDYLAGMTDRYAGDEYRRLFDPHALT